MSGRATRPPRTPRVALGGLLAGHTVAQTANAITVFATPFYVLAEGGSATDVGMATTAATVPIIIGGPLGGVLVDRIGYRRSSIVSDIFNGLTVLTIAVFGTTTGLPLWGLLVLLFLSGLFDTPGNTARTVLLPPLARSAGTPLERAVGFATGTERAATLIGAPLGGVLVATLGPAGAFFVNALAFAVSAGLIATLVPRRLLTHHSADDDPAPTEGTSTRASSYWRDLREGFVFLARNPMLRNIALVVLVINTLDAARFSVLFPLYATQQLGGAGAAGVVIGVLGGSALVGSLLFGTHGHRLPRRALFIAALALTGVPMSIGLALHAQLLVVIVLAAGTGIAAGLINPLITTLRLEHAPEYMLARVQTLMIAIAWTGIPVGALLGGIAAQHTSLATSFLVIACVYLVASLTPLTGGCWQQMSGSHAGLQHEPARATPKSR